LPRNLYNNLFIAKNQKPDVLGVNKKCHKLKRSRLNSKKGLHAAAGKIALSGIALILVLTASKSGSVKTGAT